MKLSQPGAPQATTSVRSDELLVGENGCSSGLDPEVEDAATVLEFLAWGRLKDSNLTDGLRDPIGPHDKTVHTGKDIIQTAQSCGLSPASVPAAQTSLEVLQIPQIQEMLPNVSMPSQTPFPILGHILSCSSTPESPPLCSSQALLTLRPL